MPLCGPSSKDLTGRVNPAASTQNATGNAIAFGSTVEALLSVFMWFFIF